MDETFICNSARFQALELALRYIPNADLKLLLATAGEIEEWLITPPKDRPAPGSVKYLKEDIRWR